MSTFLLVFGLFLVGMCFVVSSPVASGWGKRIFLFIVGVALWVGALILVRSQEEALLVFLFSDWALSGKLANQVGASLVLFGFGWFIFIASSVRTERKRATRFEQAWYNAEDTVDVMKVFRPWPSLLIWVPVVALLAAVWIVPVHFAGIDTNPTATATPTVTATNTPTTMPTDTSTATPTPTPTATNTPIATPEPTATPSEAPTATPEPTVASEPINTPDPSKPALACNGTWLHQEPVQLDGFRILFELCEDTRYFVSHEIGSDWGLIPLDSTSFMTGNATYEFELINGELLVNGTPFADWLASQGGE